MKALPFIISLILITSCSRHSQGEREDVVSDGETFFKMTVERLPDMNEPRGSHRTVVIGDEIVVLGGQTDGFKPLETAEYYADGAWHTVGMVYPHVNGFAARLVDGRILLGGGSSEVFGIGQSWGAEIYDPQSHSFSSAGIMTEKRALSSALTLPDSSVVIAGNWYADDSWETWTPEGGFAGGGKLSPGWSCPFILPASKNDIIIFGSIDSQGNDTLGALAHLSGEIEYVPLLEEWRLSHNYFFFPENLQIADYTYLIPAVSRLGNAAAVIRIAGSEFSLLEMEKPLPTKCPDGNPIEWSHLQADRPSRIAWMQGFVPETGCIVFARIAYDATFDGGKASYTLFYADNPGDIPGGAARLMSGGRMVLAGGVAWEKGEIPIRVDNFKTLSSAFIFHTEPTQKAAFPYAAILAIVAALAVAALACVLALRRKKTAETAIPAEEGRLTRNLMEQMSALIEEKQLYRQKNLRITDVASELATNKTYVSILLNNLSGESFTSMITRYRVEYAQKLLREHPDMLLDEVADESGFSSRTSFFRNFKAVTGMTPQEWKTKKDV